MRRTAWGPGLSVRASSRRSGGRPDGGVPGGSVLTAVSTEPETAGCLGWTCFLTSVKHDHGRLDSRKWGPYLSDRHLLSRERTAEVFSGTGQVRGKTPREGVTRRVSEGPALASREKGWRARSWDLSRISESVRAVAQVARLRDRTHRRRQVGLVRAEEALLRR
jgi:hypothetical protein